MRRRTDSWGLGILILSVLGVAGVFVLSLLVIPQAAPAVRRWVLPLITGLGGVAVLTVGHFSYPRVQNLKIYLAGYVTGLVALSYLVFGVLLPAPDTGFILGLFVLSMVNAFLIATVPAFLKYRPTRIATWITVGAELAVVLIMRFAVDWGHVPAEFPVVGAPTAVALALTAIVVFLSVILVGPGFHLRGTIAGYAVLLLGSWVAAFVWPATTAAAATAFAVFPTYLTIGGVIHWFARIEHRASYDPLLQIYNRDYCTQILAEQSAISTRPPFTIAMIDIDHFKAVNDTHGHQAGDLLLFSVAQKIQQIVVPEGVVCRYGGEEIAVFFPKSEGRTVVPRLQKVRAEIESMEVVHRGTPISVTVSIGVSYRYRTQQRLEDVVRAADKALYMCKNHGRNQIRMVRIKDRESMAKTS